MRLAELEHQQEYVYTPGFRYAEGQYLPRPASVHAHRVRFVGWSWIKQRKAARVVFVDGGEVPAEHGFKQKVEPGASVVVNQAQILMPWDAYHALWTIQDRKLQADRVLAQQRADERKQIAERKKQKREAALLDARQRFAALGVDTEHPSGFSLSDPINEMRMVLSGDTKVLNVLEALESDPQLLQRLMEIGLLPAVKAKTAS